MALIFLTGRKVDMHIDVFFCGLQKSPLISPVAEISIDSAAGFVGSPGIRRISPANGIKKPAPAANSNSLIVI